MRKNPPARYALPDIPIPPTKRSFCVQVPDDPKHIAAFLGQIKALSKAYTWQNDVDHTALLAASAWKQTFEDVSIDKTSCGVLPPNILCISGTFADLTYGWVAGGSAPCAPVWISGTGYQSCIDPGCDCSVVDILRVFDNATFIRDAEFRFEAAPGHPYTWTVTFFYLGATVFTQTFNEVTGGGDLFSSAINQQCDAVLITAVNNASGDHSNITLTDWKLCFTGDFPLSESPLPTCACTYEASHGVVQGSGPSVISIGNGIYSFASGPSDPINFGDYSLALRVSCCSAIHITNLAGFSPPSDPTHHFWSGYDACDGVDQFFISNQWTAGTIRSSQLVYLRSSTAFTLEAYFT